MPVFPFNGKMPQIHPTVFIAGGAQVIGDVTLAEDVGIWYNTVLRGDTNNIRVGRGTNIQDLTMVHVDPGAFRVEIGAHCTIGHRAIIHGCTIGDECLIGMGAIILNGARLGDRCIVGAGALVPEGKVFPAGSLLMGMPARVVREVTVEDMERLRKGALHYIGNARAFKAAFPD